MKKTLLALAVLISGLSYGQDLPMPSPTSTVQQRIGLTDFTVVYSRPSVKEREIFGELVAYNELWRTGANANTTLEFTTDILFAGKKVEAGKYSLLTIPGEEEWVIILNKKTDMWGTGGYDKAMDAVQVKINSNSTDMTETFTINFTDLRNESAALSLRWAETEVKIPITLEVQAKALENIELAIAEAKPDTKWRVYRNAANYYYNNKMDMETALKYMKMSIESNEKNWYSYWLMAEIQADMGQYNEAIKSAKTAVKIGEDSAEESGSPFEYAGMINGSIEKWKAKKS